MIKKRFFGYEYTDGLSITIGTPNEGKGQFHGRLSIAGDEIVFHTNKEREEWLDEGCNSRRRIAVSLRELRYLLKGMTKERFDEYIKLLENKYL